MKKLILSVVITICSLIATAQNWTAITQAIPSPAVVSLVSSDIESSVVHITLPGYSLKSVQTPQGTAYTITLKNVTPLLIAGAPDLAKITTSLIIPEKAAMTVEVISSNYTDYPNIDIAPSKGNLTRDIDPSTVPYSYGIQYSQNAFFPGNIAALEDPYILRDFRGQTLKVFPFQYNPVTRVLRVYHDVLVNVHKTGFPGINPLARTVPLSSINEEFGQIYENHFLNFKGNSKYTALGNEHGKMLVICYDSYMSAMQPFVEWKNTIGIPTEMVTVTTAGSTAAAIQAYVANYYNTNGLSFLLLVGDAAQAPTNTSGYAGASDNAYGYILGADHYQEIFVGRFSAESIGDVQTQVTRSINYEKTPNTVPGIYNSCIGIGSDQGPGDDNEMDFDHQRNMQTDLMGFTYNSKSEFFDGSQGGLDAAGNPTPAMVGSQLNTGAGIITYTGHGSQTSFGTSGFSNSDIATLTNYNKLPFIWSVACVNGDFSTGTCFAEGWLRATNNGQPTGAIAALMSTINQSWNPPMEAQDEMVDIMVESYTNNIKRSFGGISVNGMFLMNDTYSDFDMTDTWTLFGDPSIMVRTDNPQTMTVTHNSTATIGETSLVVNCNVPDAYVCLTINHQIIGTGIVSGGATTVTFSPLTTLDTITVAVTAFNYIPYLGTVEVTNTTYPINAQMFQVLEPASIYNCSGINVQPQVVIKNMGTSTLTSVNVIYKLDGGSAISQPWTGNLASYESDTITLQSFVLNTGSHTFKTYTDSPNGSIDAYPSNDTISKAFTVNNTPVLSNFTADITSFCNTPAAVQFTNNSTNATSYLWDFGDGTTSTSLNPAHTYSALGVYNVSLTADAGVCGNDIFIQQSYITVGAPPPAVSDTSSCGSGSFTLVASGTGTLNWYDALTGGILLYTGTNYVTPLLTTTTTYYVENVIPGSTNNAGKTDNTGGGGYTAGGLRYLVFDCYSPVTLVSVQVYGNPASAPGSRTIDLRDNTGAVLQTATVTIPSGQSTLTLNFNVPVGTGLQLAISEAGNVFRNNAGVTYPYTTPGFISVTNSDAGTGFYYAFYNWVITEPTCVSVRTPVTAYINNNQPIADFTSVVNGVTVAFTDISANSVTYFWDFGDGSTSTLQNPSHTYTSNGTFDVVLIVTNGCGSDTISHQVTITSIGISELDFMPILSIYPNPADGGLINFTFSLFQSNITIKLYNALGKEVAVIADKKDYNTGTHQLSFETSKLDQGIYFCVMNVNNKILTRKIIINQ